MTDRAPRRSGKGPSDNDRTSPLPATLVRRRRRNVFRREGQRRAATRLRTFQRPSIGCQPAHPRRGTKDCQQYRQAAGAFAKDLMGGPRYNCCRNMGANHDCSSDLQPMSAERPQHCFGGNLSDPSDNCTAESLSQRWHFSLVPLVPFLPGFAGRGSDRNFSPQRANDPNYWRLWREAIQRPKYPSVSRPRRFR